MNINKEISEMKEALASLEAKAAKDLEPKLTPISFESKAALALALIEGRTFKTQGGAILLYNETASFSPFRFKLIEGTASVAIEGVWDQYSSLQEINAKSKEAWYLNIPEGGTLCYVSDSDPQPSRLRLTVYRYDEKMSLPFVNCDHCSWLYATPVDPKLAQDT